MLTAYPVRTECHLLVLDVGFAGVVVPWCLGSSGYYRALS
jgi:hypothetical protein